MKKTTRRSGKRTIAMLMAVVLTFVNAGTALATEAPSEVPLNEPVGIEALNQEVSEFETYNQTETGTFDGNVPDVEPPTSYTEVYERLMEWQDILPTGTPWDDYTPYGSNGSLGEGYIWKGGFIAGSRAINVGCAAFACILSDVAFGNLPATTIYSGNFAFEDVRVGDILRINNNSHSVIVLQTNPAGVIVAEGNNSGKVYWGRTISKQDVMYASFVLTRYPEGFVSDDEEGANNIVDQGEEGELKWNLSKSGILTISGSGDMPDFSFNDGNLASWSKTTYPINSIVIESGITSIGDYAFYQCSSMSVDIPNTVTKIGDNAFMNSKLIGVSIPGSVTTIGYQAFRDCKNLATLTLAEGTEVIGDYAFRGCTAMAYILNIPSSVTSVGNSAFLSCSELMSVQFSSSNNAVTIGDYAFAQCWKMLSIKLPEKLINISSGLFQSCQMLGYLYIPASVQSISIVDGNPLRSSPFVTSSISQIDFGGSEETWKAIGGNTALDDAQMLDRVTVNFNVPSTTGPVDPPVEPTEPIDPPVEPTEPIDPPVEPTEPVDPPVEPTEPIDPPVEPTEPVDPPVEPTEPIDPPVEPTKPVNPPIEPSWPIETNKPNIPVNPSKPNKPVLDVQTIINNMNKLYKQYYLYWNWQRQFNQNLNEQWLRFWQWYWNLKLNLNLNLNKKT